MGQQSIVGPTSHYFYSQRLKLHYVDWGNPTKPSLVLVHGGRDHARNWDWVAQALRGDFHVIAPDLRGHGDSQWALGSEYAMIEHVLDLAQLLAQLDAFPVSLVGHSLGGAIVLQYAGVAPEGVARVAAIEGLGPPPEVIRRQKTSAHERMQDWIAQMRDFARRQPRRYQSLAEAVSRMRQANARLTEAQARHLTVHGTNRNEDGTHTWKFDNYVRAHSPYRFNVEDAWEIWGRIRCPTLLVRGTESWASDPTQDGRIKAFRQARAVTVAGAGHWVHHDRLEPFLRELKAFLEG